MKLVELRIKNFRSLGGDENILKFSDSDVIFLIGQNNVGKSSFLTAYQFFVNPKQKAALSDFFQYNTEIPIEIEGDFLKEAEDEENADFATEPDWIEKWVQNENGLITVKKVWKLPEASFEKYTKDIQGDFKKNGFGGLDTLFSKYAPAPIFVNAIETVESLEKKVNDIIEREHLKTLQNDHKEEYEAAVNAINTLQKKVTSSDQIELYNENINANFGKVFPGHKLKISVKDEETGIDLTKAFKSNHSIDVKKDGIERKETFIQHGHGVIRQALFNFVAFHKTQMGAAKKEFLLLFEEPELFLHPKTTRLLRDRIYDLSNNSPYQILCATHCPQMIDISRPHNSLVRVVKANDEKTKTYQVGNSIFQDEINKEFVQMINRFDPNICEVFYSTKVIIVEGDTEAIIVRELLKANHPESEAFVLNSGSKANIPFFQRILNHFCIPYSVIHDSDTRFLYEDRAKTNPIYNNDGSRRSNAAWAHNKSIWDEIQNGRSLGNDASRIVSVYDFETQNGYTPNPTDGKPLSAYKFVKEMNNENTLPISSFLKQIIEGEFEKDWSEADVNEVQEPVPLA